MLTTGWLAAMMASAPCWGSPDRAIGPPAQAPVAGGHKVALVVGNGAYVHAPILDQAQKDAVLVADALRGIGFRVTLAENPSKDQLERAIFEFGTAASGAEVALFYYAGHALEIDRINYFAPVDFAAGAARQTSLYAVPMDAVLREMELAASRLNLVVLDACRNNPWLPEWGGDTRGVRPGGLAERGAPQGFLISYATSPGNVAADDGTFARALVSQLRTACVDLDLVFDRVNEIVNQRSGGRQVPWKHDNLGPAARSYFPAGCDRSIAAPGPPTAPEMILVRGGSFVMGAKRNRVGRRADEGPPRRVTVDSFFVMQTEVTQGWWTHVMGRNPSHFVACGLQCPVEQVSWLDAVSFANEMSRLEGRAVAYAVDGSVVRRIPGADGYRLPTEAEWEYAARFHEAYAFAGSDEAINVGWIAVNASQTQPVCKKLPNPTGLCDMTGNVAEWVWDRYGRYDKAQRDNPAGVELGALRVQRGGSWNTSWARARVTARRQSLPTTAGPDVGLRLVRPVTPADLTVEQ